MRKPLILLVLLLLPLAMAYTPNPGHSASEIGGGTFAAGNFIFPSNVTIDGTLNATTRICLAGSCQTTWPSGGGSGGGWTNTSALVSLVSSANNLSAGAFFVDNTNSFVGINTSSPTTALFVNGVLTINGSIVSSGGNARGANAVDLQTDRNGATQVASGNQSVVGGGMRNTASAAQSTVSGGYQNTASNAGASIGGGSQNIASGVTSTVAGGNKNNATGYETFIGGGNQNLANNDYAVVAGGSGNTAGQDAFVGGGSGNTASGYYGTILGGNANTASGYYSSVPGGLGLTAQGYAQAVIGRYNTLQGTGNSYVAGDQAFIIGNGTNSSNRDTSFYIEHNGALFTRGNISVNVNAPSGYAAYFKNDGNNSNRYGIQISAGAYNGSGTTYYLNALTANGTQVGYIANNGTFQLYTVSDQRLKTGIQNSGINGLTRIQGLNVVDFSWKDRPKAGVQHGFLAQNVQTTIPEAVATSPDGHLAVSYTAMVPTIVKALQQQQAEIDSLQKGKPIGVASATDLYNSTELLSGGDLVALDTTNAGDVVKANNTDDPIIGIVTGPAQSGGYPVATTGKAYMRVSTVNGNISIGDRIGISSTPGVGAKATASGEVIGRALQPATSDSTIEVLIQPEYYNAPVQLSGGTVTNSAQGLVVTLQ